MTNVEGLKIRLGPSPDLSTPNFLQICATCVLVLMDGYDLNTLSF